MAAHQAAPSLGFSRQEHWSGLPFPSPMHESEKWKWSRSVVSDSQRPHGLQPARLLCPWDFPGKSTGVGCWLCYKFCDSHYPLLRFSNSLGWLTKLRKKHCLHLQMCQKVCNSERAKCKRRMGGCGELPCPSMPFHALPCPSLPFHALPWPSMPFHVLPCPSLPFHALPCPSLPFHALPCPSLPFHALPCPLQVHLPPGSLCSPVRKLTEPLCLGSLWSFYHLGMFGWITDMGANSVQSVSLPQIGGRTWKLQTYNHRDSSSCNHLPSGCYLGASPQPKESSC